MFLKKITLLKSVAFYFKTQTNQVIIFFGTRLGETLTWKRSSTVKETDFKVTLTYVTHYWCI